MTEPVDFFVHIPKTAGTTIQQIIRDQYPPGTVFEFFLEPPAERAEKLAALPPQTRIVRGHVNFSELRHCPRPCRPFTFLRDPTDRLLSLYYYIAQEPTHVWHAELKDGRLTIDELARTQGRTQALYLAGYFRTAEISDEQLLAEAKARLADEMVAFGLTERFDESLLLLNRALGWKVRGYTRANITEGRPTQDRVPPAEIAAIRARSSVDQALYDFGRQIFEERIAAQPPGFAEELGALRSEVAAASQPGRSWLGAIRRALRGR